MISLSPLIPSIDEHNRVWKLLHGFLTSHLRTKSLDMSGRSGDVQDGAAVVAAVSGVGPSGGDAGEAEGRTLSVGLAWQRRP